MAALRERAVEAGYQPCDTLKLFWDTYGIRITFDAIRYTRKALPKSQQFRSASIHEEILSGITISGKTSVRHSGDLVNVYFTRDDDALAFFEKTQGFVTEVTCPRNEDDIAVLAGDGSRLKVQFRKSLFWGKFPYRVVLKDGTHSNGKFAEMKDWVRQFSEVSPVENKIEVQGGTQASVYFSDEHDLLFFKLVFHEQISKLEKALLIKDIADVSVPLEGAC